jgi:hypothetical protein
VSENNEKKKLIKKKTKLFFNSNIGIGTVVDDREDPNIQQ